MHAHAYTHKGIYARIRMQNVKEAKRQRDQTHYASKYWVFRAELGTIIN